MRWIVVAAVILMLGACSGANPGTAAPTTAVSTTAVSTTAVSTTAVPTTSEPTTEPTATTVPPTAASTTPAPPPPPPTTARPRPQPADPATVVQRFYAAINDHDYQRAWALGGRNLGNRSYEAFVAGFGDTDHDDLEVTGVRGQLVDVTLVATQDGCSRQTIYAGTYRVVGGVITSGRLHVIDRTGAGPTGPTGPTDNCDPAYPDLCIPPPPPDLDCSEIGRHDFTVLPPDPHHFDRDRDGIGCEE